MKPDAILEPHQFDQIAHSFSGARSQAGAEQRKELDHALKTLAELMRARFMENANVVIRRLIEAYKGEAHVASAIEIITSQIGSGFEVLATRIDENISVEGTGQVRADFTITPNFASAGPFHAIATILRADKYRSTLEVERLSAVRITEVLYNELHTIETALEDLDFMELQVKVGDHERWKTAKKERFDYLRESKPAMVTRQTRVLEELERSGALLKDLKALSFDEYCQADGQSLIEALGRYCTQARFLLQNHDRKEKSEAIENVDVLKEMLQFSVIVRRAQEVRQSVSQVVALKAVRRGNVRRLTTLLSALGLLGTAAVYFWPEVKGSFVKPSERSTRGVNMLDALRAQPRTVEEQRAAILEVLSAKPVEVELKILTVDDKSYVVPGKFDGIGSRLYALPFVRGFKVMWDVPDSAGAEVPAKEMVIASYERDATEHKKHFAEAVSLGDFRSRLNLYPWKVVVQHDANLTGQLYDETTIHETAAGIRAAGMRSVESVTEILLLGLSAPGSMGEYWRQMVEAALRSEEPDMKRTYGEVQEALKKEPLKVVLHVEDGELRTMIMPNGSLIGLNYIDTIRVYVENETTDKWSVKEFGPDRGIVGNMHMGTNAYYSIAIKDAKRLVHARDTAALTSVAFIRWKIEWSNKPMLMRVPKVDIEITPEAARMLGR